MLFNISDNMSNAKVQKYSVLVSNKRKSKILPKYLSREEVEQFFKYTRDMRDVAIFKLMVQSGLRLGEVITIKPTDIDREDLTIKIFGKGRKERVVPIKGETLALLEALIKMYKIAMYERIFDISRRRVQQIVKEISDLAGFTKNIHPHMFRHTFAIHSLKNQMPINVLQKILGHSKIVTTQIYIEVVPKDVCRSYEETAPF